MRADCEVRVGTVSEGMSRLARLVLLQRRGCIFERIPLKIGISPGLVPLCAHGGTISSQRILVLVQRESLRERPREVSRTKQSEPDT